jgi:hypothetical protein
MSRSKQRDENAAAAEGHELPGHSGVASQLRSDARFRLSHCSASFLMIRTSRQIKHRRSPGWSRQGERILFIARFSQAQPNVWIPGLNIGEVREGQAKRSYGRMHNMVRVDPAIPKPPNPYYGLPPDRIACCKTGVRISGISRMGAMFEAILQPCGNIRWTKGANP